MGSPHLSEIRTSRSRRAASRASSSLCGNGNRSWGCIGRLRECSEAEAGGAHFPRSLTLPCVTPLLLFVREECHPACFPGKGMATGDVVSEEAAGPTRL